MRTELLGKMMAEYMAVKKPLFTVFTPLGLFKGIFEPTKELKNFIRFDPQGLIIIGYSKLENKIRISFDR